MERERIYLFSSVNWFFGQSFLPMSYRISKKHWIIVWSHLEAVQGREEA